MKMKLILHVLVILLAIISLFMLIPAGIALFYGETHCLWAFLLPILVLTPLASLIYIGTRNNRDKVMSPQ